MIEINLHTVLGQLANVELKLELIAEEAREGVDDDDGRKSAASPTRRRSSAWNAGRRSSVAVLPGSTNSRLAPTQDGHDRERCGR